MNDTTKPVAAVSGAQGGIGRAVCRVLREKGFRVIGIDRPEPGVQAEERTEVQADLATPEGRAQAVAEVRERSGDQLTALVCAAGLGGTARPPSRVVAVNHFGATALLDGLWPALQQGRQHAGYASAVAVASVSATSGPWRDHPIEQACLADDEARSCALADESPLPYAAYGCSKRALIVQVRRRAAAWGATGVRLNAIAPGPVDTPLHHAAAADPVLGPPTRAFVPPLGRIATPDEIATTIAFLLSPAAAFVHGSVLFADGGCDGAARPDRF